MNAEQFRSRLRSLSTYEDASEFFGDLGYTYADDAPVPTRNWPESLAQHRVQPRYIAQHGDFKVIYCEIPGERMLRTVQRAIIDQLVREHAFFMIVFHQVEGNAWDFVNVSVTRDRDEHRIRRIARRIAVTEAERVRDRLFTASVRLAQIDINRQQNITALQVQSLHNKAFDVEQVTKDFYLQYTRVFAALSEDIARNNPSLQHDASVEALRLLDRLMFLYFIQKKGWLNQQYDYLYTRFQDHTALLDTFSYYERVIVPLFIALANRDSNLDLVGNVPFLNGGLFQFDQSSPAFRLKISNQFFQQAFEELFEKYNFTVEEDMPDDRAVAIDPEMLGKVFESLILNIEQEKDLRKATGSYYTPRTVVSFMCQQSLREYIVQRWREGYQPESPDGELPLKLESKAGQQELRSAALDQHEREYQQRIVRFVEDGIPSELSKDEARRVRGWLLDVRVIDPAVGSGAFLVGMLQEIIRLVTLLDDYTEDHDIFHPNYSYSLKRDIIGRCLYGVDIQPQAVQICELRLWLSLVVDYEPEQDGRAFGDWIRDIEPLPNLSYLVRQGNSLIEQVLGKTLKIDTNSYAFDQSRPLIAEIQDLKSTYFRSTDPRVKQHIDRDILAKQAQLTAQLLRVMVDNRQADFNKKYSATLPGMEKTLTRAEQRDKEAIEADLDELRNLIRRAEDIRKRAEALRPDEAAIKQLRNQLGAFIWRVDFGEVFAERDGFDIAIANPPYIRQEKIKELKPDFQKLFPEVYTGTADLYVYFYAQALRLLRTNGVLTFITPNKFLLANYGKQLRQHLSKNTSLELLIDFGDLPVFDATTYPFITMTRRRTPPKNAATRILNVNDMATLETLTDTARNADVLPQNSLRADGWQLIDTRTTALLEKLRSFESLDNLIKDNFYRGVTTGLNEAFVIDVSTRDRLVTEDSRSAEIIHPWLRGRDIKRWEINWDGLYVIFTRRGIDIDRYPAIKEYLMSYQTRLMPGANGGRKPGPYEWYEIQDSTAYYELFEATKIIYPDISLKPQFTLDNEGHYIANTLYCIPDQGEYLLGILNSRAIEFYYSQISPQIQNGYFRFIAQYMRQIPIPTATPQQRVQVETVVKQLLMADNSDTETQRLENQLNALVYALYRLTPDEIALIEEQLGVKSLEHDVKIEAIREVYDEGWLVVEVTAFDDKTRLPERGIVRHTSESDDEAYRKADELKQEELEAKTFYVFFNEKEA